MYKVYVCIYVLILHDSSCFKYMHMSDKGTWIDMCMCVSIRYNHSYVVTDAYAREPQGDIDPDEDWFEESHWLVEDNKITGIKMKVCYVCMNLCMHITAPYTS